MQHTKITTTKLKDTCPKCGENLLALWHIELPDYPEAGEWEVECGRDNCDYTHPEQFLTLEALRLKFEPVA